MTQLHVIARRVSPALKVDLVQIGRFKDGEFDPLPLGAIAHTPIAHFLEKSDISDSLYVKHSKITDLLAVCKDFPGFVVEFFDNTIVLMFDFDLNYDEGATKEEGKGN
nr:MAG TPA: hypothetical protein [Microviridae sp.]